MCLDSRGLQVRGRFLAWNCTCWKFSSQDSLLRQGVSEWWRVGLVIYYQSTLVIDDKVHFFLFLGPPSWTFALLSSTKKWCSKKTFTRPWSLGLPLNLGLPSLHCINDWVYILYKLSKSNVCDNSTEQTEKNEGRKICAMVLSDFDMHTSPSILRNTQLLMNLVDWYSASLICFQWLLLL